MARHGRDTGLGGEFLGGDLVAHRLDGVRVGTDEGDVLGFEAAGKAGILRQEAEAGMDRLGTGLAHGVDDPVFQQIGLGRRSGADQDGLIGHLDREGVRVRLGIDLHGADAHAFGGLDDADGDLAAIGDQYL